jgi:hypothetical protein
MTPSEPAQQGTWAETRPPTKDKATESANDLHGASDLALGLGLCSIEWLRHSALDVRDHGTLSARAAVHLGRDPHRMKR